MVINCQRHAGTAFTPKRNSLPVHTGLRLCRHHNRAKPNVKAGGQFPAWRNTANNSVQGAFTDHSVIKQRGDLSSLFYILSNISILPASTVFWTIYRSKMYFLNRITITSLNANCYSSLSV